MKELKKFLLGYNRVYVQVGIVMLLSLIVLAILILFGTSQISLISYKISVFLCLAIYIIVSLSFLIIAQKLSDELNNKNRK